MRSILTHIALHVRDLEKSIEFYREYCGLTIAHDRGSGPSRVVWLSEPGKERQFVFVLLPNGQPDRQVKNNFSHLGFALSSRQEVDKVAEKAEKAGLLFWPAQQKDYPVGYFCGVADPDGRFVEFSYGQPLGPGSK